MSKYPILCPKCSLRKNSSRKICVGCGYKFDENAISIVDKQPSLADEWDYEKNEGRPEYYTYASRVKTWWVCKTGHSWDTRISDRTLKKNGCPICSGNRILQGYNDLTSLKSNLLDEWDYDKNKKLPSEYTIHSGQRVWWKCKEGHSWKALIYARVDMGCGCPGCAGQMLLVGENDLKTKRPDLIDEWDYSKNDKNPEDYMEHSNFYAWWLCKLYKHSWKTQINARTNMQTGCPICAHQKFLQGFNDLKTLEPELCEEWDYKKNDKGPESYTRSSKHKAWWICGRCDNSWKARIGNRVVLNRGCPKCCCSKLEDKIIKMLQDSNINFKHNIRIGCINPKTNYELVFDFYLPDYNFYIEANGIQHYKEIHKNSKYKDENRHTDKDLDEIAYRDSIKKKFCLEKNIYLLEIPYTEIGHIENIINKALENPSSIPNINEELLQNLMLRTASIPHEQEPNLLSCEVQRQV